jgi:hypothetical protein
MLAYNIIKMSEDLYLDTVSPVTEVHGGGIMELFGGGNDVYYKRKYLKYKSKYLNAKYNQKGGSLKIKKHTDKSFINDWTKIQQSGQQNCGIFISDKYPQRLMKCGGSVNHEVHELNEKLIKEGIKVFPHIYEEHEFDNKKYVVMDRLDGDLTEILYEKLPVNIIDEMKIDEDIKNDMKWIYKNMMPSTMNSSLKATIQINNTILYLYKNPDKIKLFIEELEKVNKKNEILKKEQRMLSNQLDELRIKKRNYPNFTFDEMASITNYNALKIDINDIEKVKQINNTNGLADAYKFVEKKYDFFFDILFLEYDDNKLNEFIKELTTYINNLKEMDEKYKELFEKTYKMELHSVNIEGNILDSSSDNIEDYKIENNKELMLIKERLSNSKLTKETYQRFMNEFQKQLVKYLEEIRKQVVALELILIDNGYFYEDFKLDNFGYIITDEPESHLGKKWTNSKFLDKYYKIYCIDWDSGFVKVNDTSKGQVLELYNTKLSNFGKYGQYSAIKIGYPLITKSGNIEVSDNILNLPEDIFSIIQTEYKLDIKYDNVESFDDLKNKINN